MDTYNLIEVRSDSIEQISKKCPTIYEFEDKYNNKFSFYSRHGGWQFSDERTDKVLVSGSTRQTINNWEDVKKLALEKQVFIKEI